MEERDPPLKLDSSRMANLYPARPEEPHLGPGQHPGSPDYLGGLEWSGPMKRYMRGVLPRVVQEQRTEEERERREWWTHPYIIQQLQKFHGFSSLDLRILADLLSSKDPYHEVAKRWKKSISWLRATRIRAVRLVRTIYFPRSRKDHEKTESTGEPVQAT